ATPCGKAEHQQRVRLMLFQERRKVAIHRRIAGFEDMGGNPQLHSWCLEPRQALRKPAGRIERCAGEGAEAGNEDRRHQISSNAAICSTARVGASVPAATCVSAWRNFVFTAGSPLSRAVSRSSSMDHIHLTCWSRRRDVNSPD